MMWKAFSLHWELWCRTQGSAALALGYDEEGLQPSMKTLPTNNPYLRQCARNWPKANLIVARGERSAAPGGAVPIY